MLDHDDYIAPVPNVTECLLSPSDFHNLIKPNDSNLIDMANSINIRNVSSPIELVNFSTICLSTLRPFGRQTSPGIQALELKVIQCKMMLKNKFPDFKAKPDVVIVDKPVTQHVDMEHEHQQQEHVDFQQVKYKWLAKVEERAKFAQAS
jgi:hypothetical protein